MMQLVGFSRPCSRRDLAGICRWAGLSENGRSQSGLTNRAVGRLVTLVARQGPGNRYHHAGHFAHVVMAAGLAANLSLNPLDAVTTVTSQIVTILVGDQEFESAKTLSAFALALTLIVITLGLNFMALQIVKKYREQYE